MREGIPMSRNRSRSRTIARVEVLEGRQLMAADFVYIHFGALTGNALADFQHGQTPAADGWRQVESISYGAGPGNRISSFNALVNFDPSIRLTAIEKSTEVEVVIESSAVGSRGKQLVSELDFKPATFRSIANDLGADVTTNEDVSFAVGQVKVTDFPPNNGASQNGTI
jgi:hypothetical protein